MKKPNIYLAALFALPLLMVLVASNPEGVTVFDGETARYLSWLQTVSESPWGLCAPMAALLNYVFFGLAVVYGLMKKNWCLRAMMLTAFAAACVAALPIVVQSQPKIVPNVLGVILLCAEGFAAYVQKKEAEKAAQAQKPKGKALKRR